MKKIHLIVLILSLILMVLSGFSIAIINMVYTVPYDWYSTLEGKFKSEFRNANFYEITGLAKEIKPKYEIIDNGLGNAYGLKRIRSVFVPDFSKYLYVYVTLGEVSNIDSIIKITRMAQRGNTIEIITSINNTSDDPGDGLYYPEDMVRVDKSLIINKGKVLFVFKNQYGTRIGEIHKLVKIQE